MIRAGVRPRSPEQSAHVRRPWSPDPGAERATDMLIAAFDDERHARKEAGSLLDRGARDGYRDCLGCGWICGGRPAYECMGGGPRVYDWCRDCLEDAWSYRIPWERFYRLIAPRHAGQLELFGATS